MSAPKSPGSRAPFPSPIRGLHLLGEYAGGTHGSRACIIRLIALVGALGWWQTFYGEIHRLHGATHRPWNVSFVAVPPYRRP
jgi:hypothetical protein